MFSIEPDASKAAFLPFVWWLAEQGCTIVDSQVRTAHVESMGGKNVPKADYLRILSAALRQPGLKGNWSLTFPGFPDSAPLRSLYESGRSGVS